MVHDPNTIPALYKRLLRLYPRRFRDELGESMEQTFNDLYKERWAESTRFGFVLWTFAETGMGIFSEYMLLIAEGASVKSLLANPRSAPVISFILCVLPFMILEWATRSDAPRSDASPMLWAVLWLLSMGFIAILILTVRNLRRAGSPMMAKPVPLLLGVIFFVLLIWMWGALIIDQMPCFLGGSGC